jgi:uncharacterized membrane protein YdjX (TVP38/TMEM64 family)
MNSKLNQKKEEIDMKRIIKLLIVAVWVTLIYILFRFNLLTGNIDNLNNFFNTSGDYKALIFIALSSIRIVALIPSAVFMILGGVIFNPFEGVILTLISILLSETSMYVTSKVLVSSRMQRHLVDKYPKLYESMLKNNTRILAIGILCPIAPSDVTCFLVSSTGIKYRKFILTIIISNLPMIILYSFLGSTIMSSMANTIIVASVIIVISIYSVHLWNIEKRAQKLA